VHRDSETGAFVASFPSRLFCDYFEDMTQTANIYGIFVVGSSVIWVFHPLQIKDETRANWGLRRRRSLSMGSLAMILRL
jgi:hypothetical protein